MQPKPASEVAPPTPVRAVSASEPLAGESFTNPEMGHDANAYRAAKEAK